MRKRITKKMIKGINLNDEVQGENYQDIINDINDGIDVDLYYVSDSDFAKKYNEAVWDVMMMLLLNEFGNYSCDARSNMLDVMYKYNIGKRNTSEQNLRSLDWRSACGQSKIFKFSACLNMGLNHFDIFIK